MSCYTCQNYCWEVIFEIYARSNSYLITSFYYYSVCYMWYIGLWDGSFSEIFMLGYIMKYISSDINDVLLPYYLLSYLWQNKVGE